MHHAEKASKAVPWTRGIAAAALKKMGEENRAEEMIKNFKSMNANDFENTTKELEEEAFKEENDDKFIYNVV